jgi:hypothetical protein
MVAAKKVYNETVASAYKVYNETVAPANEVYNETIAPANKVYNETMFAANKVYNETMVAAYKVYNETMVPIEGVTLCQFTGCIRNDLDPVMVAGKQYCYGHSYLMDFIERGQVGG